MRLRIFVWLLCCVVGLVCLALPERGARRLFSLSEEHGPSTWDAVGAAVLTAGWLVLVQQVWNRRDRLTGASHRAALQFGLFALGLGLGLLVASVFGDFEGWWMVGAGLLALVQLVALLIVTR